MLKVYRCYKKYPAEYADVYIYLEETGFEGDYAIKVSFVNGKNPLEEFSKKWCANIVKGSDIAEQYIKTGKFEKVIVGV